MSQPSYEKPLLIDLNDSPMQAATSCSRGTRLEIAKIVGPVLLPGHVEPALIEAPAVAERDLTQGRVGAAQAAKLETIGVYPALAHNLRTVRNFVVYDLPQLRYARKLA